MEWCPGGGECTRSFTEAQEIFRLEHVNKINEDEDRNIKMHARKYKTKVFTSAAYASEIHAVYTGKACWFNFINMESTSDHESLPSAIFTMRPLGDSLQEYDYDTFLTLKTCFRLILRRCSPFWIKCYPTTLCLTFSNKKSGPFVMTVRARSIHAASKE